MIFATKMPELTPHIKKKMGRPKGSLNPDSILRARTKKNMDKRIFRMAEKLVSAQSIVALGTHKMIRMFMKEGIPSVETIRDEKRMQDLLDNGVYGEDYLIVVGTLPDAKAANMLLDRAFGKAKESITLDGDVKFSLKELASRRAQLSDNAADAVILPGPNALLESGDAPDAL